jgi:hypothetical protein
MHEQIHNSTFVCHTHPDQSWEDSTTYKSHLIKEHSYPTGSPQLDDATARAAKLSDKPGQDCIFCGFHSVSLSDMQDHVAIHLQRLALFSLPGRDSDDSDSDYSDLETEGDSAKRKQPLSRVAVTSSQDPDSDQSERFLHENDYTSPAETSEERPTTIAGSVAGSSDDITYNYETYPIWEPSDTGDRLSYNLREAEDLLGTEMEPPRGGATRVPSTSMEKRALSERGYSYEEEVYRRVIEFGLSVNVSYRMKRLLFTKLFLQSTSPNSSLRAQR